MSAFNFYAPHLSVQIHDSAIMFFDERGDLAIAYGTVHIRLNPDQLTLITRSDYDEEHLDILGRPKLKITILYEK